MAAVDVERIIQCIKDGDQDGVQARLKEYNTEYAECFFYNVEEKERRKQRELEEFRRNKVREYVPDSDSDLDADESEDPELILRRRLAAALIWFIRTRLQPGVLKVCLRSLRILTRDRQALAPLVTDTALLTLARYGGISALPPPREEDRDVELYTYISEISVSALRARSGAKPGSASPDASDAPGDDNAAGSPSVHCATAAETPARGVQADPAPAPCSGTLSPPRGEKAEAGGTECWAGTAGHGARDDKPESHAVLARGKRDAGKERGEEEEDEEEGEDDMEVWRKEAMKALCNVIYNSQKAQERASTLRLLSGLSERLKRGTQGPEPPSGQFYDLRLLFLLTALRPELRSQLQKERGVSLLTAALEQCLEVQWGEGNEVLRDPTAPLVSKEVSQRAMEILKTLFNITYNSHRQQPNEEDAALYRRLAAVLHHCLLLLCDGEERTEELQGHTVNVLSALPLQCLDVLLSVRLSEGSREWEGVNMDCVHALLLFMEKRLDRGHKLKEKLTPVLNLLTESCRAHRETRHYLKQQILPPLRDVTCRPEQGPTVRGRLVRLMTHVDTDVKQCSAELLFVLCKENVSRFVKYTGYGNAAGLLAARGLLGGAAGSGARTPPGGPRYSSDSDSDTEEYREAKGRINPVTGRVEEAQPDPMAGMTEEEKEEEACKLINMFNRLSRDNIIQPMGVTADGRLAPLCGQMRDARLAEERESEEESDEVD
ncbi:synembryn-A [Anguilla anguilla]|uniref:synembryn-A n=1 Tax=Anguilla anguilla TaxID=7936 RepID=UPI0015B2A03E|nr:synembryn-A [Anguilla anguilla]XP_035253332.1 synembryn-A [Anguilla anguilla]